MACILLCAAAAATAAAMSAARAADDAPPAKGFAVGAPIPADWRVTLTDLSGASVLLKDRIPPASADVRGALLVFWATWCAPCIQEIPTLRSLNDFYRAKGFRVIGVGMNEGGDTLPLVKAAVNRHGINYEVLFDAQGEARTAVDMPGIPWSVLVDGDGVVQWAGPALPKDASARIRAILTLKEERGSR